MEKNIVMTMLQDDDGVPKKTRIRKKGSTLKMPLCVLHIDRKRLRYRIRLPDGAEALLDRRYVLESTDKPDIEIICDGDPIHVAKREGGVRGSGEDPCD